MSTEPQQASGQIGFTNPHRSPDFVEDTKEVPEGRKNVAPGASPG